MIGLKSGKVYRFKAPEAAYEMRFWAQDGFICMVDEGDGQLLTVSPQEFADRAYALYLQMQRMTHPSEKLTIQRVIDNMKACAKEAIEQGSPTDPKVREYYATHHPKRKIVVRGVSV